MYLCNPTKFINLSSGNKFKYSHLNMLLYAKVFLFNKYSTRKIVIFLLIYYVLYIIIYLVYKA